MPRRARIAPGGWIVHVLNRANGRAQLFESSTCYRDFLRIVEECAEVDRMRVLAYCAMPNHWHMLLWPREDGDLFRFVHRLTIRHTQRWNARNDNVGRGHVYQARYKSFVVQDDSHLLTVCRYIERNPLRAGLVSNVVDWQWSSARDRAQVASSEANSRDSIALATPLVTLTPLPIELPSNWLESLNEREDDAQVDRVRASVASGNPFGVEEWSEEIKARTSPLRRGRPGRPPKVLPVLPLVFK